MSYTYGTVNSLAPQSFFQFISGGCVNQVVHIERNLLVYTNIVTGKTRRFRGFVDLDKEKVARVRYVKLLDATFNKYYADRREIEDLPF